MQEIRHRSHTSAQARRFTIISWALLCAFGIVGYIVGRPYFHLLLHPADFFGSLLTPHPSHGGGSLAGLMVSAILPLVVLVGMAQALKELIPLVGSWGKGDRGEKQVLQSLGELSDDYVSVTNWVAPGGKRGDVDLMVIGPMGIVTVEIKTYSGVVAYEYKRWWKVQPNGRRTKLKDVSGQGRGHEKAVLAFYRQEKAKQASARQLPFVEVTPVIVFVGADELRLGDLDMPALTGKELPGYIMSLPAKVTGEEVQAVAGMFAPGGEGKPK